MTASISLRDKFWETNEKPSFVLDPRFAQLIRMLARATARRDYEVFLSTGQQPGANKTTKSD